MTFRSTLPARMLAVTALLAAGAAAAKDDFPEITEDGLQRVQDSKLSVAYVDPDADFSIYDKVMLLEPHVAFKKNWQRDQNRSSVHRVSTSDMDKIKSRLKEGFHQAFVEVLEADDGYPVVEETGEDVLLVRPAIVNLDPVAPDVQSPGRSRTYTESAGEMTLYVELYDSITGDIIGKALDRQIDRRGSYMQWQTSASNRAAANRILKGWAQVLRDGLDEVHANGSK